MPRLTNYLLLLVLAVGASRADAAEQLAPFADVLAWQASQETSSVWASVISSDPATSTETFTPAQVDFDWNAGLRAGFEFTPDESLWSSQLYWTYFPTEQTASIADGAHLILPESFSGFISGLDAFLFTAASIEWELDYNTIDLVAGRDIPLTETLSIRPTLGLKAAIINQSIQTDWQNPLIGLHATGDVQHDYWGLGPAFGIDGRWEMKESGFSLVGSFSGAFMNGVWNVTDRFQHDPFLIYPGETITTSVKDSALGTLMLRYFFGLRWSRPGHVSTAVHLGYELEWWANQQRLPTFQQLPMHGDLTLQGASCGVSFSF